MSSTLFCVFSILLTIYYLQIIDTANGVIISEEDTTSISDVAAPPIYDINTTVAPSDAEDHPQNDAQSVPLLATSNIPPENLQIAIPVRKAYNTQKKRIELQSVAPSKEIVLFKPNQQLQVRDDPSIEEISTSDLLDEETFELKRNFKELLKMFAKNYNQQTNVNDFPIGKTNSLSVWPKLNQNVPANVQNQLVKLFPKIKEQNSQNLAAIDDIITQHQTSFSNPFYFKLKGKNIHDPTTDDDTASVQMGAAPSMLASGVASAVISAQDDPTILQTFDPLYENNSPDIDAAPLFSDLTEPNVPSETIPSLLSSGAGSTAISPQDDPTILQMFDPIHQKNSPNIDQVSLLSELFGSNAPSETVPSLLSSGTGSTAMSPQDDPTILQMFDPIHKKNSPNIDEVSLLSELFGSNAPSETVPLLSSSETVTPAISIGDQTTVSQMLNPLHQEHLISIDETSSVSEQNVHSETDPFAKLKQTVTNDIDTITERFTDFALMSTQPIFIEHQQRVNTLLICCQLDKKSDGKIVKKFVDAYGSVTEQMNIIDACAATLVGSDQIRCTISLQRLKTARQTITKFTSLYSDSNSTTAEEMMEWLDKAPQQSIDVKNVVYDYNIATHKSCIPALLLLWEPRKLIQCETKYRLSLLENSTSCEEYDQFNQEISAPFQQKALNLIIDVKHAWYQVVERVKKSLQAKGNDMPISDNQINNDVNRIKDTFSIYSTHLRHPMIVHLALRAHVYQYCCRPIETSDMFDQYLANFDYEHKQGDYMDKLLTNCIRHQLSQLVDEPVAENKCNIASNDLNSAMKIRHNFINKYGKENPDMIQHFQQAIRLKKDQALTIHLMKDYVDRYCKDQHIFELMFQYKAFINCQTSIRYAIGKENSKHYLYYDRIIAHPFENIIQEDWDEISKVLADVKVDDEPTPKVITQTKTSSSKPIPIHDPPKKHRQSMGLVNSASSIPMVAYQCFSLLFMFMIQIILL